MNKQIILVLCISIVLLFSVQLFANDNNIQDFGTNWSVSWKFIGVNYKQ